MTIPPAAVIALRDLSAKIRAWMNDDASGYDTATELLCDVADDLDALVARVEGTVGPEHDPDCAIFQWDAFAPCSCGAIACVESQVDRLDAAVGVLEALQAQGIYLHDASGQALDREQFIAAVTKALNSLSESRSPDGDGLPMTTGLGDGASLTSTPNVLTPPQAHVHAREMRSAESSLKPAAGSEPADSHTHRATARVESPPREQEQLRAQKDAAYAERDQLVAALSKLWPAHLARHPDADTAWENDWRWIVCIHSPVGQLTWHIHDSERDWFNHLEVRDGDWDGHATDEKYARLAILAAPPSPPTQEPIASLLHSPRMPPFPEVHGMAPPIPLPIA